MVLVCGDRNWIDFRKIVKRICQLPKGTLIIHGACRGADQMAAAAAFQLGMPIKAFPANWDKYGKAAGPYRNQAMIDEKPDLVIAFHSNLSESTGTIDTINRAKLAGIPYEVVT